MYGVVKLGKKEVPMMANAATPIRYRQVFGKNILQYFLGNAADEETTAMVSELAYIMARAGENADMNKLNIDDYIKWLEDFGPMDFVTEKNARAIMAIYQGNEGTSSTAKKNQGRQSEK